MEMKFKVGDLVILESGMFLPGAGKVRRVEPGFNYPYLVDVRHDNGDVSLNLPVLECELSHAAE